MTRWLVMLGLMAGCSFALSGPDPNRPHGKAPDCSTSKTAVVADGLFAGVSAVIALSLAGGSSSAGAIAPLAVGALFTGAAVHGNGVVNDCRRANMEYLNERAPGPMPIAGRNPDDEPVRALKPPSAPVQPTVAAQAEPPNDDQAEPPAPQPAKQAAQPPAAKSQPPPAPAPIDTWSNFWKEVR